MDENRNNLVMPVQPMGYGGGYGNGGFGGFGNGDWSWILLLILLCGGGWGFGGGFGGMGGAMMGADMFGGFGLYPWMNQAQLTTGGFDHASTQSQLGDIHNAITGGFSDTALSIAGVNQNVSNVGAGIQNSLCNGFAGVNQSIATTGNGITAALNSGFSAAEASANSRQIANMQQAFAAQTAQSQGFNALQAQLAQCCCDNRLGTESLRATVLQENCQDRYEAANNTRDIIANATANTQAILDKLCALELDGYKRENDSLRSQLTAANLAASQTAQTAQILAGQAAEIDGVYNRLKNCPVPSMPVYGNTPIFTCPNNGYGCGCGG